MAETAAHSEIEGVKSRQRLHFNGKSLLPFTRHDTIARSVFLLPIASISAFHAVTVIIASATS